MATDSNNKTNVARLLENAQIDFRFYEYDVSDGRIDGCSIAGKIGESPDQVFKTLVTVGAKGEHYVFMIPVAYELDLKKAAKAVGDKSIAMIKSKELLPLTGYIHGGCSPIGMKKQFKTVLHETAQLFDTILFSAGKIGYQVELTPDDLQKAVPYIYADITV